MIMYLCLKKGWKIEKWAHALAMDGCASDHVIQMRRWHQESNGSKNKNYIYLYTLFKKNNQLGYF